MVSRCERCLENSPTQRKEPLMQTVATRPMEQVSIDLAQYGGKIYLVLAYRYSGWILVEKYAKAPDQATICTTLENWFLDVGRPLIIRSDGGPQFRSRFEQWCKNMMIKHELSSSYNPQSNGHAEQAVKTVKGLLKRQTHLKSSKMPCLNGEIPPRYDGLSPNPVVLWVPPTHSRTRSPLCLQKSI